MSYVFRRPHWRYYWLRRQIIFGRADNVSSGSSPSTLSTSSTVTSLSSSTVSSSTLSSSSQTSSSTAEAARQRDAETTFRLLFHSVIGNLLSDGQTQSTMEVGQAVVKTLLSGIGTNQASRAWHDLGRMIETNESEDIDLHDFAGIDIGVGLGKDGLGQNMDLEQIVLLIVHQTAGPGRLELMPTTPANAVPWISPLTVSGGGALRPGGVFLLYQPSDGGFDVTDGLQHIVRLRAHGGDVTYNIHVVGRHDDEESSSGSSSTSSSQSTTSSMSSVSSN